MFNFKPCSSPTSDNSFPVSSFLVLVNGLTSDSVAVETFAGGIPSSTGSVSTSCCTGSGDNRGDNGFSKLTKVVEIFLGDTGESRADAEDDEDELAGTPAANFASDSASGTAGVSFLIVLNGVSPQAVGRIVDSLVSDGVFNVEVH